MATKTRTIVALGPGTRTLRWAHVAGGLVRLQTVTISFATTDVEVLINGLAEAAFDVASESTDLVVTCDGVATVGFDSIPLGRLYPENKRWLTPWIRRRPLAGHWKFNPKLPVV